VPPSGVDPEIPAWADSIVLKAMAKDPADRYQSAADMRTDIQRALSGVPVAAPPRNADMYPATQRLGPAATDGRTGAIPPYQYGSPDAGYGGRQGSGRRKALWWILGAVLAIILAVVAFLALSPGGKTYAVPSVVGMSQAKAQAAIARAGLQSNVVPQASDTVAKNDVISTNPPFGNKVAANSVVTLYVSSGPKLVKVPNVVGQQQAAAQTALQNDGFQVVVNTDQNSVKPAGTVVAEAPPGGTSVAPNSKVTISVSGGAVQVPNVVGDPVATAQQILKQDGFNVQTNTVAGPANATAGTVFQQQPTGGPLAQGSTVTIFVAASVTPTTPATTPAATPTPTATATATPGG
jgi:serine/threonine-protein kinase